MKVMSKRTTYNLIINKKNKKMKKVLFLAVFVASATAVMAAKNSSWPVGETFPATFPFPHPSQETVYPVFPKTFPVYPQSYVYPEPEQSWPTEP